MSQTPTTSPLPSATAWETIDCPICGGSEFDPLCVKGGETTVRCRGCGLALVNPRPRYADIAEAKYVPHYSAGYIGKAEKKIRRMRRWVKRVQRFGKRGGRWLDVGCSAGFVLKCAKDLGFEPYGVDVEGFGLDHAREAYGIEHVYKGFVEELDFPDGYFDVISCYDVIEHVPDLNRFVDALARLLAPGGIIDIRTPDVGHWTVPKDLATWDAILPGEHLYNFDRNTLTRLVEQHGLRVVKRGFNLKAALMFYVAHA